MPLPPSPATFGLPLLPDSPMPLPTVKICGLKTPEDIAVCVEAGASMIGYVFFEKSPRHLSLAQAAALSAPVPSHVARVALVVDPTDEDVREIEAQVAPDFFQLHGHETPERVAEIAGLVSGGLIKALPIAERADVEAARAFEPLVDWLLFDAKPPKAGLPGGNGLRFDWTLLETAAFERPWLLSGGLTPENVAEALACSGAPGVDVSSGVERARGVKDADMIRRFIAAAQSARGGTAQSIGGGAASDADGLASGADRKDTA